MELRHRVWNWMGPERRLAAARAFWDSGDNKLMQQQAESRLAQRLHARPVFVRRLAPEKKAAYLAQDPGLGAVLWDAVMFTYHSSAHREMLTGFLDALGIAHKNGRYEGTGSLSPPAGEQLETATRGLLERYPKPDVLIYLAAVASQDEEFWKNLLPIVDRLETEAGA